MQQGWGGTAENELPDQSVLRMQQNLYKFSAAKHASMQLEINQQLYDKNGNLLPFDEFKAKLDSLGIKYNKTWLQTEYRTAKQSGQTAQFWQDIQANKALYPNLKYKTQEDDRVRDEHEKLNDIIAPIDDDFWNWAYPPNGWNCRCFTVQTAEEPSNVIPKSDLGIKPEFHMNVGKTGQVFNENTETGHRFFALAKESPDWEKRFELSKLEGGFNTVKTPKGNKVKVSIYAHEKDLVNNLEKAIQISDQQNINVEIRPHLNIQGWKNPEYKIGNIIADLYRGDIKNGFLLKRKQIKKAIEQLQNTYPDKAFSNRYAIVFDITNVRQSQDLAKYINGKFRSGNNLEFIIITNKSNSVKINRTDNFETIEMKYAEITKEK